MYELVKSVKWCQNGKVCKSEVVVCSEGVNDVRVGLPGGYIEVGVGLPRGMKWCKSGEMICSEGLKYCKSWAAKGVKRYKIEGVI